VVQHVRKLSALAALREFFTVSPLWMRGATAFAGLLLCALIVFAVSRLWQKPVQVVKDNGAPAYSREQFEKEVQKQVNERVASLTRDREQKGEVTNPVPRINSDATHRVRSKTQQSAKLTREERVQLAADLGLIPGREEDVPFVLPDEPNQ
jgi:hypothetical protein